MQYGPFCFPKKSVFLRREFIGKLENSRELDIKPRGEGYLKAFKDDFANVVRGQINKLS